MFLVSRRKFDRAGAFLAAFVLGLTPATARADGPSEEYLVKAAFLFRFAQFVEWPPETFADGAPMNFCTVGSDPFSGALETTLAGKKVGSHPAQVVHLKDGQDFRACQFLFIGPSLAGRAGPLLASLENASVVTVGEGEHFAEGGGMIGFCWEGTKIRFDINVTAAEKAKLRISARLLSLARKVIGGGKSA